MSYRNNSSNYRSGGGSYGGGSRRDDRGGGGRSGSSWGGRSQMSNNNIPRSQPPKQKGYHPNQDLGRYLRDVDWSRVKLDPFTKVFYKEGQSKRNDEEIRQFRTKNEIRLLSEQAYTPNPFITWDETFFPGYIMQEIKKAGFGTPTPIQSQSFPIILSGNDLIGIAKTGSGKTLSFLLPSVVHINAQPTVKPGDGPIILVLAPTRELAVQIQDECQKFGSSSKITSTCVYGGSDKEKQKQDLKRGVDICIATPGRLIDFLDKGVTNLKRVTYLVLDEADRMLDMGFEPQIRKLLGQIRPDRQTLMFSATWPKEVQSLAQDCCQNVPLHIQIGNFGNTINKNIRQICEVMGQQQKFERLIKYLESMGGQDKVLIFTQTKKQCDNLTIQLRREKFPACPIHGDKSQADRDEAIESFKQGTCRILIATDVAQRGLDIRNITFVINFDFPKHIEDYIHRIGRTGRAGADGTSISFMTYDEDKFIAKEVVKILSEAGQDVSNELRDLMQAGVNQKMSRKPGRGRSRSPTKVSYGGSSFAELKRVQQSQQQRRYNDPPTSGSSGYQQYGQQQQSSSYPSYGQYQPQQQYGGQAPSQYPPQVFSQYPPASQPPSVGAPQGMGAAQQPPPPPPSYPYQGPPVQY